jgi:hypothetical protein
LQDLGFSISGEIGLHHLVDLEAHLTTNPAPPILGKTTAGRRRIGKLFPAGLPALEVILDLFRSLFDLVSVMKVDLHVLMVLLVKFCDHRRWSVRRSVGSTRRRLGWRVRARPAFSGEVV